MSSPYVTLQLRYWFLLFEVCLLLLANSFAFGTWLPSAEPKGMWFYAALFGLLLGHRLDTPFFTSPVDAMLYSLPSLFTLLSTQPAYNTQPPATVRTSFLFAILWSALLFVLSSIAISLSKTNDGFLGKVRLLAVTLTTTLGTPRLFFSVILVCLLVAYPPDTGRGTLCVAVIWGITVPFSILDSGWHLVRRLRMHALNRDTAEIVTVDSFQQPRLLTLRTPRSTSIPPGSLIAYRDNAGDKSLAISAGPAGKDTGSLTRAFEIDTNDSAQNIPAFRLIGRMEGLRITDEDLPQSTIASIELIRKYCVGFIGPESDMNSVIINLVGQKLLGAGSVVSIQTADDPIFYQVTNGTLKEETLPNRNAFAYVNALANCIGRWSASQQRFLPIKWVPDPNSPATLVESNTQSFQRTCIGTLPGTGFSIQLSDPAALVTHNTAILGVLGVGKSTLAMELIERILATKCKVIILDLTAQYAGELSDLHDDGYNNAFIDSLQSIDPSGRENYSLNVEEGGNCREFTDICQTKLAEFMKDDCQHLLILNPAVFEVWKQDSRIYANKAAMATLTACEITGVITQAALQATQDLGLSDSARVCLVYEEAHALIPEFSAAVGEGDKAASNRTARAILQGRKYGLGCMIITQRTANVTKTILNQCNTIFAMRSFDDTGKEFLANFIGRGYAASLPTLREREAIVFGRASSCENPVRVRLNDRADFKAGFRSDSHSASQ